MSRILITGGTGFLGRALTRKLLTGSLPTICIYSRDEAKQARMREELPDPDGRLRWFIGDVRDVNRLTHAMQGCLYVIHAAALKRVEVGEYNPGEMVKTNVQGAMNVIEAATKAGVYRVVAVSTDKACQPRNTYGASKLMAEKLFLASNQASGKIGPDFKVVRYGNVAGSTGSVIPMWRRCVAQDHEAIMTDPSATRFWMTVDDAVELVLAVVGGTTRDTLIIPALRAYRLAELATAMDVVMIRVTGLGPGEKLHERLQEDGPDSSQAPRLTVEQLRELLKEV